jgi:hypothetical protein
MRTLTVIVNNSNFSGRVRWWSKGEGDGGVMKTNEH